MIAGYDFPRVVDDHGWQNAWNRVGGKPAQNLKERLIAAYGEPARVYHTLVHLEECLTLFDRVESQAHHPEEVELALWFHDAVYEPTSHNNEAESARWAETALSEAGAYPGAMERIARLILLTRHRDLPQDDDGKLMIDIDLAILGSAPDRFERYEMHIRQEYHWVPEAEFRLARSKILKGFLLRTTLYQTHWFRKTFEDQARINLAESIKRLTQD